MEQKTPAVTREGYERLRAELNELIEVKRPEIVAEVADARSHGDLRENAAYDVARQDQAMNERRIADLEEQLRNVEIIEESDTASAKGVVRLGSKVVVDFDGEEEQYTIVGAIEAKPFAGLISNESPIGQALVGKKAGDKAQFEAPGGSSTVTIKSVD